VAAETVPGESPRTPWGQFPGKLLHRAGFGQSQWLGPSSNGRAVAATEDEDALLPPWGISSITVNSQGWVDFSYLSCGCSKVKERPSVEVACEKTA